MTALMCSNCVANIHYTLCSLFSPWHIVFSSKVQEFKRLSWDKIPSRQHGILQLLHRVKLASSRVNVLCHEAPKVFKRVKVRGECWPLKNLDSLVSKPPQYQPRFVARRVVWKKFASRFDEKFEMLLVRCHILGGLLVVFSDIKALQHR